MVVEEIISEEEAIRDAPPPDLQETNGSMSRYLYKMAAVMAVLYLAPFFFTSSHYYDRVNLSYFARPLNYAFTTAGQNADVVVFGDSTALFGIDPSRMSSELGMKVLNLPNTQGSLLVNDDLVLRRYLASNRPPKLIIFYFAAWDFDYGHTDFDARPTYEGQELLLRQGTRDELLSFAKKHPIDAISYPLRSYAAAWKLWLGGDPMTNQSEELAATHGHIDSTDRLDLSNPCTFPSLLLENIRFDWVRSLGARYSSPETKVLFYVAPVPSCTNVSAVMSQPYSELPAAPPIVAPPGFFSSDVRYIHPRPFAVPELTHHLTEAVRPLVAAPDGQAQPSPADPDRRFQ